MKHRAKSIVRAGGAPRTVDQWRGEPTKDDLMERARKVQAKANAEASIAHIDAWEPRGRADGQRTLRRHARQRAGVGVNAPARIASLPGISGLADRRRKRQHIVDRRLDLLDNAVELVNALDRDLRFVLNPSDKATADLLLGELWPTLERARGLDETS